MVLALFSPGVAGTGAVIKADSLDIDFGTINEGSIAELKHTFRITNTGDATLQLLKVKKNCGCTSFAYDSLVFPGKTGNVIMTVDLREIQSGDFHKSLIVTTNAPKRPLIKFAFSGTLVSLIDADLPSIVLPTMNGKDTVITVTLSSEKSDLVVNKARFDIDNPAVAWQASLPIKFRFAKTGKQNRGKRWLYTVKLHYFPVEKQSRYGSFVLSTNHPKKSEVRIAGVLDPLN
ncbi:MAG: DUF1573 domain-containing protein [Chitinispirillaceae bacterium]|nr:DUF1573 domain-containing protein [Chitinispirillaceae bacterium]